MPAWRKCFMAALLLLLYFAPLNESSAAEPANKTPLTNPYNGNPQAVAEGRRLFLQTGCPVCHSRGATGGRGPDLTDDLWIMSGTDQVLFRTIMEGRQRKGEKEKMLSWKEVLEPEQVWKIIAWIRSLYKGDPNKIAWGRGPGSFPGKVK